MGTTGLHRPPLPSAPRLEAAGRGMRRVRTQKADVTWLQGPGPTDLWTWREASGEVRAHELTFFGRTVVWKDGRLVTGLCHEDGGPAFMGKTGLLDFDARLDPATLEAAALILAALPGDLRSDGVVALEAQLREALGSSAPPAP